MEAPDVVPAGFSEKVRRTFHDGFNLARRSCKCEKSSYEDTIKKLNFPVNLYLIAVYTEFILGLASAGAFLAECLGAGTPEIIMNALAAVLTVVSSMFSLYYKRKKVLLQEEKKKKVNANNHEMDEFSSKQWETFAIILKTFYYALIEGSCSITGNNSGHGIPDRIYFLAKTTYQTGYDYGYDEMISEIEKMKDEVSELTGPLNEEIIFFVLETLTCSSSFLNFLSSALSEKTVIPKWIYVIVTVACGIVLLFIIVFKIWVFVKNYKERGNVIEYGKTIMKNSRESAWNGYIGTFEETWRGVRTVA